MIQIAICDNEPSDLENTAAAIHKHLSPTAVSVQTFLSSSSFLQAFDGQSFDILFLGIEESSPTGYEVAQKLHNLRNSPLIIFIARTTEYAIKGYGLAFRFLLKPYQEKDLIEALDAAIAEIQSHRLSFKYDGTLFSIPISDIVYIESSGHFSSIHTDTAEYIVRQTLANLLLQLPSSSFFSPHKSFLVNMQHILYISSKEVQMSDQVRIPISRRKRDAFASAWNDYLGR